MTSSMAARIPWWLAGFAFFFGLSGCHRVWYRQDADKEASHLIQEKSTDPRWAFPDLNVYMDPRSRYYDPTDPDHSPMPEDDPASNQLMRRVDHKRGSKRWFKDGVRDEIENPGWRQYLDQYLEITDEGRYKLRLHDAVILACLHSPAYQTRVEEVYLTALDVAFERFRFDVQFFGGLDAFYTLNARDRDLDPQGSRGVAFVPAAPVPLQDSDLANHSTGLTLQKLFPTGAELLVNFANSVVWQYAGADSQQTLSLLNFNFIQPLLRLGGRDVVLERLTRVERGLLANVRGLGRYRETYFAEIALGDEATGGPKRAGGFLGGSGLERGFSGIGVGGFGGAGEVTGFGRLGNGGIGGGGDAGSTGFVGGGAGLAGGYIGLAQFQQELQHREANLVLILREKERMQALFNANRIDRFQVEQFNQSVQTQLSQLLKSRSLLQSQIDAFLVSLGLPPDLPVQIEDGVVRQFEFFDPAVTALEQRATSYITRVRQLAKPALSVVQSAWQDGAVLHEAVVKQAEAVRKDLDRARDKLDERLRSLAKEEDRQDLRNDIQAATTNLDRVGKEITQNGAKLKDLKELLKEETADKLVRGLTDFADAMLEQVGELSLVQARARLELLFVPPVEVTPQEAFLIARANRLDWMNQRAALVDQWRLIGFNADRLESDLNIVFSGDLSTPLGDNAFDFRRQTGRLTAGVQFDPPLTRKAQRNEYREALINFQMLRRSYIQYTDGVHQSLRHHLRTLAEARENLELQRNSFNIALRAFNLTRLKLREPPKDEKPSPTTARDLLGALSDLLGAQNNFMSVWIQYEAARMRLYRDLGIMQFDEHGNWLELPLEPYRQSVEGAVAPEQAGDPVLPPPRPAAAQPADQENDLSNRIP